MTPPLIITQTEAGLLASGELDLTSKPRFMAAADQALLALPAGPLTLDLTGLLYIDSAGLEAVIRAYKCLDAEGRRLKLIVKAPGQVARVLTMCQFQRLMDIEIVDIEKEDPS